MLGSPGASTLALPKSHSLSTWLAVSTSRFCAGRRGNEGVSGCNAMLAEATNALHSSRPSRQGCMRLQIHGCIADESLARRFHHPVLANTRRTCETSKLLACGLMSRWQTPRVWM